MSLVHSRKAAILLHESNMTLLKMMRFNLEMEGFGVFDAVDLAGVLGRLAAADIDLVLLNWGEGGGHCIEICRAVRARPHSAHIPVVIASAPREERERLQAYEAGADDVVMKPFSLPELFARIRAILRRTSPMIGNRVIRIAGLELDVDNAVVKRDGAEVRLSVIEFKILRYLMENAGKVRTREQIRNAVWGRDTSVELRAVDVRITRLRRRLNGDSQPDVIRTVRSIGYSLGEHRQRLGSGTASLPQPEAF